MGFKVLACFFVFFVFSYWIMSPQQSTFPTKTLIATSFHGTVSCCCMVWNETRAGVMDFRCGYVSYATNFRCVSLYLPKSRTTRHRKNLTLQSSRPEVVYPIVEPVMWLFYHWAVSLLVVLQSQVLTCLRTPPIAGTPTGSLLRLTATVCSQSGFRRYTRLFLCERCIFLRDPEVACHTQWIYRSEDFVIMSNAYSLTDTTHLKKNK